MVGINLNKIIGMWLIFIMVLILLGVGFGKLSVAIYGITLIAGVVLILVK